MNKIETEALERGYRQLNQLEKVMAKRIKAKTGHLRGAAWHAARKAKAKKLQNLLSKVAPWKVEQQGDRLVASLSEASPPAGMNEEAPRVWFKIWELKEPGLYVASTSEGLTVVRAIFRDDGVQKTTDIVDAYTRDKLHGAIVAQSAFQKIKE